jgi:signal recognition particle subunit SRP54
VFDTLAQRLQKVFDKLNSRGRLSEQDVDAAMREVRLALLEADVNFKVVKEFVGRVREKAVGADITKSLTPSQQVVKIVHQELIETLGPAAKLDLSSPTPRVVMLVGLQGSGKTTTAAKLALKLRQSGQKPLLVAADTRRPAAIQQLQVLGRQIDVPVHAEAATVPPATICADAVEAAIRAAQTMVILDTAGRLHIDDDLMTELEEIKARTHPSEILLVADSMTGQDAVRVAEEFNQRVGLTGLILTKVDGDARGGAAISMRAVTGVPIKFLGVGEKMDGLEPMHPDRLASRILGMGDVLSLIERAEATLDRDQALAMQKKLRTATFDLDDFRTQLREIKKMGPVSQLLEMIPGMSKLTKDLPDDLADSQLGVVEAIINSMTAEERHSPDILNASRKRRVAKGSGTEVQDINQLLNQFRQMQKMMKGLASGKRGGLMGLLRQ